MIFKHLPIKIFIFILFFSMAFASEVSYKVYPAHSSVKFKVRCLAVGNVVGKFSSFSGNFSIKDGKFKTFNAVCNTKSISTGNAKRDKSLKSAAFFNTTKFSKMTMSMLKLQGKKMLVKLTIKGITKTVIFKYIPNTNLNRQKNIHHFSFQMQGTVYMKNFDLDLKKAVGSRSMILGKTVKIVAKIEGKEILEFEKSLDSIVDDVKQIFSPE